MYGTLAQLLCAQNFAWSRELQRQHRHLYLSSQIAFDSLMHAFFITFCDTLKSSTGSGMGAFELGTNV